MTQRELKRKLHELIGEYFKSLEKQGNIVWGMAKPVNPGSPKVALTAGPIKRPEHVNRLYVDGIVVDVWPSKTTLQVDLFTKGAPTTDNPNVIAAHENTAVNDLTEFVDFLHSVYVDRWSFINDVSLNANNVQDLTELINDTSWKYRAMVEIEIGFTQVAVGFAGLGYDGGIPFYRNGRPKFNAETGMPLHDNGQPMYDAETGMPLHSNGRPMYDSDMNPLDVNGNVLPEGKSNPLPPPTFDENGLPVIPSLPFDKDGFPIIPPLIPNSSGGGSQELADEKLGWFEEVEIEHEKEAPNNGEQS